MTFHSFLKLLPSAATHSPRLMRTLLLGCGLSPVVAFVNQYLFDDWQFALSLGVVIGVDTVLGWWKHWQQRSIASEGFGQLFRKVVFYALFLLAVHAVARHRVEGQPNSLLAWLNPVAYSLILAREFLSILENSAAIGIFTPPAWLLTRLKVYEGEAPKVEAPAAAEAPEVPAL